MTSDLVTLDEYNRAGLMAGALIGSLPVANLYASFAEHDVSSMTRR